MKKLMTMIAGALSAFALFADSTGVTVNGTDVGAGSGEGWTYDETTHYVEVTGKDGSYVLSGTNTEGEVMFAINADAEVTLSNLCLKCTTVGECCLWATNNVNVTLYLAGTNTLDAYGEDFVDTKGEGLCIENGSHLVVTNAPGFADADAVLIANGSYNYAAIAVGRNGSVGKKPYFEIAGGTVFANWELNKWPKYSAGIGASYLTGQNGEADIVISGGRVFARGGWGNPGIGAADYESMGAPDIQITGGYVEAVGGQYASAIGGGQKGKYGSVTVSGGTVRATGGYDAFDMIAGKDGLGGGDFTVTGGNIWLANDKANPAPKNAHGQAVYRVLVQSIDSTGAPVTIEGLEDYGTDDIYTHDGQIWLWLPNGVHTFAVNGTYYRAEVNDGPTRANWHLGHDTGVTINGREVAWLFGSGWRYHPDEKYVEVTGKDGSYVLSGTNTAGEVMFAIDENAEVTLSNLCLKCTTAGECCLWATNDVNVTLFLAGTNTLDASANGEGICIENDTRLTITNAQGFADEDAVLIAKGGPNCAAIATGRNNRQEGKNPYFEIAGGTVIATGGGNSAGIGGSNQAGKNSAAVMVISGGRVFATGAYHAAGIGSSDKAYWGGPDITITGGYVEAQGGEGAAGIGGGYDSIIGACVVRGGTVRASAGSDTKDDRPGWDDKAADMLGGHFRSSARFVISGGSVCLVHQKVRPQPKDGNGAGLWCVTVEGLEGSVSLEGLAGYGTKDIVAVDGKICLWLPNGTHGFKVNGVDYIAEVNGANTTAQPGKVTGVTVNGVDVGFGSSPDWTYNAATHSVVITGKDGSYVLSGANTAGEVMFKIDVDASVTLSNLTLKCGDVACVRTANDVDVTLLLAGKNSLLGAPIYVGGDSRLVITNAPGFAEADAELTASVPSDFTCAAISLSTSAYFEIAGGTVIASSMNSVAIGGDVKADIVISGGHVTAGGGGVNPAIGGLKARANAPNIRITGGYVVALSETRAAAIGGGEKGGHGSVEVSGGTVLAQCALGASDMIAGASDLGGGDFTVTGGSIYLYHGKANPAPSNGTVRVWCVTVPGVATDKPAIEGLPDGYGTKDVETINGKIYLWLPNGRLSSNYEYTFTVGGKTYKARVYNSNADAVEQPATPLAPGQSSLPYNTEAEARTAIAKHLVNFGPTDAVKTVLEASTILTVAGYKEMFTPVVYQTKEDGKWRVMYELTSDATNTLMQSIHAVVANIDLAKIAAGGVETMSLEGGVPGFYYTLFASDAVTSVTEPSSRDKTNSDKLCDEEGVVTFLNVEKPSDAAGFFTVSVSPEQAFTSGEPSADVRGGGIIVLPPVITTGSDD